MEPYTGTDKVIVGNGSSIPISYMGLCSPTLSLTLNDVFVVPQITKNLLFFSKFISDFSLFVSFIDNHFIIQNLQTRKVVASGDRVDDFYVLKRGNHALSFIITKQNLYHFFDIWHARLVHVSSKIISMLNKKGFFFVSLTFILAYPFLYVSCQKAKSHKLPFQASDNRSHNILGLIHCDL